MTDPKEFAEQTFKSAQSPSAWLLSAERSHDAAEAILSHEQQYELPYLRAYDSATHEALAIACSDGHNSGFAEIKARVPNYPAAQLQYAYALENLLKGIMVAKHPSLVSEKALNKKLLGHDLMKLSKHAGIGVHAHEIPIVEALSKLSVWAGRYPVALYQDEYVRAPNADALLDYGSRHPYVRGLYDRCHAELTGLLSQPISSRFGGVVVERPPGT